MMDIVRPFDDEKAYDEAPQAVKDICDSFDEDKEAYSECRRVVEELQAIGWTAEYYLQGELFNLKKLPTLDEIIEEVKEDKRKSEELCSKLKRTDTEYYFWNGARCQASVILEALELLKISQENLDKSK